MPKHRQSGPSAGRGRSQRQLRVGELIRHALVEVLTRGAVRDPGLGDAPVTVTEVRVSPDLRNATVFVLPLGGAGVDEAVAALRRAAPYLRRLVGEAVTMRYLPSLSFQPDTAFEEGQRLDDLLRSERVRRDLENPADEPAQDAAADEKPGDGT